MGQLCGQRVLALLSALTSSASQPEQNPTGNVPLAGREAMGHNSHSCEMCPWSSSSCSSVNQRPLGAVYFYFSGCGSFKLHHWHHSPEHPGVLLCHGEAHCWQCHTRAAPWEMCKQISPGQNSASQIEPPCPRLVTGPAAGTVPPL